MYFRFLALTLALLSVAQAVPNPLTPIKQFVRSGGEPLASLVAAPDGFLYGTTVGGGLDSLGSLFKIRPDGTGLAQIHSFRASPLVISGALARDGILPWAAPIVGLDGALYGTTQQGGQFLSGTIYKVQRDGTGYALLHVFAGGAGDGVTPFVGLVQGTDGTLYGATFGGGAQNKGVVFKLQPDGSGFTLLHTFVGGVADGVSAVGTLSLGGDGTIYGTTQSGGANSAGIVFKVQPDGTGFTVVQSLPGIGGTTPKARVLLASDGVLYGTTSGGGTAGAGTLFKVRPDGTGFATLRSFGIAPEGGGVPTGDLIQGADGALYGITQQGGASARGAVFKIQLDGSGYTVVRPFAGGASDGMYPVGGVVQLADGTLCGTTRFGGPTTVPGGQGYGTVFRVRPDGTSSATLAFFTAQALDGEAPLDRAIIASDGRLYGTTSASGAGNAGTAFGLNLDGTGFAVLHAFTNAAGDGGTPSAGLIQGADGALYGTTQTGGAGTRGTVFKVQRDGTGYSVLRAFTGTGGDGALPRARLVQATNGTLYGTTFAGGTANRGTVFKLQPDGTGYGVLYSFNPAGAADGADPLAGLLVGPLGALYGTASSSTSGGGVVYRIQPDGTGYTMLHAFDGSQQDLVPRCELIVGDDGALYGTTFGSFGSANGAVFKLRPDGGGYTVLHVFGGGVYDGAQAGAGLTRAPDGTFYGATFLGPGGNGTVYRMQQDGSGYALVRNFTGGDNDGYLPTVPAVAGDGSLYVLANGSASTLGLLDRIVVNNVAPIAASQAINVSPSTATAVTLSATDADTDPLTYLVVNSPSFGFLTGTAPNLTYTPVAGYNGADTLTFVAGDGTSFSNPAIVALSVGLQTQTLAFTAVPDHVFGDPAFVVAATASSGLPVTFSVVSGPATINAANVTVNGVGAVTVQASQAGNGVYAAATATRTFQVTPAPAVVTLSNLTHTYDGTPKSATASTVPGGLATTITYNAAAVLPTAPGAYAVVATVTDANYTGAANGTLTIAGSTQTVSFPSIATRTYGSGPFTLIATASSGLPVAFSIVAGPASVAGAVLTVNGTGSVTVRAAQAGDAVYPAASATQTFQVTPGTAGITLTNLTHAYDGTPKSATATTTPGGLALNVTYNGTASAPTAPGNYTVSATVLPGNYTGGASATLTILPPVQTVSFRPTGPRTFGDAPFNVIATASSGLPVTLTIESGPATLLGGAIKVTGVGNVTVRATQAGNDIYPAASATDTFPVNPAAATIGFSGLTHVQDGKQKSATITTTPAGLATTVTYNGNVSAPSAAGSYVVVATIADANYAGTASATLTIQAGPEILAQPKSQPLSYGGKVDLVVTATGDAPLAYQWQRDGADVAGATDAILTASLPGSYRVNVSNAVGATTSAPAAVFAAVRLSNYSVRARVGTGDAILIPGFGVSGNSGGTKRLLIRAVGPGLAPFGMTGVLAQPQLTIYAGSAVVASNTGWATAANPAALASAASNTGAFALPVGSADSAVLVDLAPGSYTALVRGAEGGAGIALAEIYELDSDERLLVNLAARLQTGADGATPIVGFTVSGSEPARVLVRAIGPGLAAYGVSGVLGQPQLTVYAGQNVLATNAGWSISANAPAMAAAAVVGGAFPLLTGSADSALLLTLPPGSYSATVNGVGGTNGVALLEAYQVP